MYKRDKGTVKEGGDAITQNSNLLLENIISAFLLSKCSPSKYWRIGLVFAHVTVVVTLLTSSLLCAEQQKVVLAHNPQKKQKQN